MAPIKRFEYVHLKIADIPDNIIKLYDLGSKVSKDGYVYVEVRRGMYGLPQAEIFAQQLLEQRLNAAGYSQIITTPGLWTHKWRLINFTLWMDDSGVKYVSREHAQHLMDTLQANYTISHDWEGTYYLGLDLDWDYCNKHHREAVE